jgi:excisionase family DNA binding protein
MSLDAALEAIPALVAAVSDLQREVRGVRELLDARESPWISRAEAAERLGVHVDTVDAMCRDGRLEHRRAGRRVLIQLGARK